MRDAHEVPQLSSWKQAGLLSLPVRLCGRGGPAVGPAVLSLSWTEAHCTGKVRGVLGPPIDLPLSVQCALILASACGCPGLTSWVFGCLCGPEATVPIVLSTPLPYLSWGSYPRASWYPWEVLRVQIWKLRSPFLPPFSSSFPLPPPFLPLPLPLSLSLLPNASWLSLNISPPRFLAPALGSLTKGRRASSPPPPLPQHLPLLRSPSEGGSSL